MKKNLIYTIIAVVLAIATITVGLLSIFQNIGDTTITIGTAKAMTGDVVEIPVSIEKNHGIWGGQILIDYDSDNLSFVSVSKGTVFDECEINDAGGCVALLVTQSALKNTNNNGDIVILKFKVKVSADKGEQSLSFNNETNFCNADEEIGEPVLKGGKITVK